MRQEHEREGEGESVQKHEPVGEGAYRNTSEREKERETHQARRPGSSAIELNAKLALQQRLHVIGVIEAAVPVASHTIDKGAVMHAAQRS